MSTTFSDRHIVLGVSGSISTYKAVYLTSSLVQAGATVDVIMTQAATQMVQPLSFQALTHRPVYTDLFDPATETPGRAGHVALGTQADAIVLAPATANTLARLAVGLADNFLLTTCLAARCPIVVAPAMESGMWSHPAIQAHIATLVGRGVRVVGPEAGYLASGASGLGRLAAPEAILEGLAGVLAAHDFEGRHVVITAGGTREAIDPVRYISNHSSGKMGYALAEVAAQRGARVTLIHGPSALQVPPGVVAQPIESAADMFGAVREATQEADALLMAAAVADYRPAQVAEQKIKKADDDLVIQLVRNPDILSELKSIKPPGLVVVGWAAETNDLLNNARSKLARKDLDMIVANPVPQTFGGDLVQATLLFRDGALRELAPMTKHALAGLLLDTVKGMIDQKKA